MKEVGDLGTIILRSILLSPNIDPFEVLFVIRTLLRVSLLGFGSSFSSVQLSQ